MKTKVKSDVIYLKMKRLEQSREILKSEFAGIDDVIDQMLDVVSPWYVFPELQESPVIVNLWGLTGTGKSSLVKRFAQLIEMQHYFRFDLAEANENRWSIRTQLENIFDYRNGLPLIIGMDEFQHARTIKNDGEEVDNAALRVVWDLLDSGTFQITKYGAHFSFEFKEFIRYFKYAIKAGVKIENGHVVAGWESYVAIFRKSSFNSIDISDKSDTQSRCAVGYDLRDNIFQEFKDRFSSTDELTRYLETLNGQETLLFLQSLHEGTYRPVTVDCTKALIFVMGNLDEAYQMSGDFNPDMNADEFHRQSLLINISKIKQVLKRYFRNEQIARLGNIHIIYPALNELAFRKIIQNHLNKIQLDILSKLNLKLLFDQTIEELIYQEGVYPAQGTRPLFTTIHQLIRSQISRIEWYRQANCIKSNYASIKYSEEHMQLCFYQNKKKLGELAIKPVLNLEKLRKEKKDDMQALVAVHESGHAVLMMILMRKLPDTIFSNSVDGETEGFVTSKNDQVICSKIWIRKELAVRLGGLCAERIVFGEDGVTLGSDSDIKNATALVMHALKSSGFGSVPMKFGFPSVQQNYTVTSNIDMIEQEAHLMIEEASQLANETLVKYKKLLLELAKHLSNKRTISNEELRSLFDQHTEQGNSLKWFSSDLPEVQYRQKLQMQFDRTSNGNSLLISERMRHDLKKTG